MIAVFVDRTFIPSRSDTLRTRSASVDARRMLASTLPCSFARLQFHPYIHASLPLASDTLSTEFYTPPQREPARELELPCVIVAPLYASPSTDRGTTRYTGLTGIASHGAQRMHAPTQQQTGSTSAGRTLWGTVEANANAAPEANAIARWYSRPPLVPVRSKVVLVCRRSRLPRSRVP